MADDPNKRDERDRRKVASGEDYEVEYFAKKAGISLEKARQLIDQYGNNRETLMKHARNLV